METLIALWTFLVTTGTNTIVTDLFLKNILLLWLIVKVTPWAWDNKLFNELKQKFTKNGENNEK